MEEKFFFKNGDGLKLSGILSYPEKETNKCIVLCHGITVDKNESGNVFKKLSDLLVKEGFATFRFDFRGHGESEGSSFDLTVTGEVRDLESVMEFLKKIGFDEFGILAASFAGGPVALFVGEHSDNIRAIVFWNSIIDYDSLLKPTLPWPKKYFGKRAMEKLERDGYIEIGKRGFEIGNSLIKEVKKLKPWERLLNVKIPMLFIHGDADTYVPYNDSVKYSKMLGAKLVTIENGEHGLNEPEEFEKASKAVIKFFKNFL
ncbi:MAG: alpha/beta fold hydrolase [Candidatus Aenigmarchaeota archaeon]|nr:alpha/beta fold hydrolase [Candidatus Aenigmarchaeota archaeon]